MPASGLLANAGLTAIEGAIQLAIAPAFLLTGIFSRLSALACVLAGIRIASHHLPLADAG